MADQEHVKVLSKWFVEHAEMLTSVADSHAEKLVAAGIATINRLAKKVSKTPAFLTACGIAADDAEEVIAALVRFNLLDVKEGEAANAATIAMSVSAPAPNAAPSNLWLPPSVQPVAPVVVPGLQHGPAPSTPAREAPTPQISEAAAKRRVRYDALLAEATGAVHRLTVAVTAKDILNINKTLSSLAEWLENRGEYQRVLVRAGLIPVLTGAIEQLHSNPEVCNAVLKVVNYMCRYTPQSNVISLSEDNTANAAGDKVSDKDPAVIVLPGTETILWDVIKALGVGGMCDPVVGLIKQYADSNTALLENCCDVVRNLCALESNRALFSDTSVAEWLCKALMRYSQEEHMISWLCRAIGALCANNERNALLAAQAGACELIGGTILSRHMQSAAVATEACYVIRYLSAVEENRTRLTSLAILAPDLCLAALKTHISNEALAGEAMRAIISFYRSEDDSVLINLNKPANNKPEFLSQGIVMLTLKAFKKHPNSAFVHQHGLQLLFLISLNEAMKLQMVHLTDVLDGVNNALNSVGHSEGVAEFASKLVFNLAQVPGVTSKMKAIGLCESVVRTLQRHALNVKVLEFACFAVGALAKEKDNLETLADVGACEGVIGAIRRHVDNVDVVYRASYAVHFLSQIPNNVAWMGTIGGCDALTDALNAHTEQSILVAQMTTRAIGSLAYRYENNMARFRVAKVHQSIITAMNLYPKNREMAEFGCRAIYHLGLDNAIVTDFGNCGACKSVVEALRNHEDSEIVVAQACLAVHALAVKRKQEKVQPNNIKKLVTGGVMELVVKVLWRYKDSAIVHRAGMLSITSLAKSAAYRVHLGNSGACELISASCNQHFNNELVFGSIAAAIDNLATDNRSNCDKLTMHGFVPKLLRGLVTHEKNDGTVVNALRALITLAQENPHNLELICTEAVARSVVKLMKVHEKSADVARWSCQLISIVTKNDTIRSYYGNNKACELIIASLKRHASNANACMSACKAVVSLSKYANNLLNYFSNGEICAAVIAPLAAHPTNAPVCEQSAAAVEAIAIHRPNIPKLITAGAGAALIKAFKAHYRVLAVTQKVADAITLIAIEPAAQSSLGNAGACEDFVRALEHHIDSIGVCKQTCMVFTGLARHHAKNQELLNKADACRVLAKAIHKHYDIVSFAECASDAVGAIADGCPANMEEFSLYGTCAGVVLMMHRHKHNTATTICASRAARILGHSGICALQLASAGVVATAFEVLELHQSSAEAVEHCAWLLGSIAGTPEVETQNYSTASAPANASADGKSEYGPVRGNLVPWNFYTKASSWSLLDSCLHTHSRNVSTSSCLCQAMGMFAQNSKTSNAMCCNRLKKMFLQHTDNGSTLGGSFAQRALYAIGAVCASHADNQQRFVNDGMLEIVTGMFVEHAAAVKELSFPHGMLRAIAGLVSGSTTLQNRFRETRSAARTLIRFVHEGMEDARIVRWGCEAIISLVSGNYGNQSALWGMCSWLGTDCIGLHVRDKEVTRAILDAISALTHGHVANRSAFGVAGACHTVCLVFNYWRAVDESIAQACCRAVANLAANHQNNQQKLGISGVCDSLMFVLTKYGIENGLSDSKAQGLCQCEADLKAGLVTAPRPVTPKEGEGDLLDLDAAAAEEPDAETKAAAAAAASAAAAATAAEYAITADDQATYKNSVNSLKWCMWAIGNIVRLGKGASMVFEGEEDNDDASLSTLGKAMVPTADNNSGLDSGNVTPTRAKMGGSPLHHHSLSMDDSGTDQSNADTGGVSPNPAAAAAASASASASASAVASINHAPFASSATPATQPAAGGVRRSSMLLNRSPGQASRKLAPPLKTYSRRYELNSMGICEKILVIMRKYSGNSTILQWSSRVVASLAKVRDLRNKLRSLGAEDEVLAGVTAIKLRWTAVAGRMSEEDKEVLQWTKLALESLNGDKKPLGYRSESSSSGHLGHSSSSGSVGAAARAHRRQSSNNSLQNSITSIFSANPAASSSTGSISSGKKKSGSMTNLRLGTSPEGHQQHDTADPFTGYASTLITPHHAKDAWNEIS